MQAIFTNKDDVKKLSLANSKTMSISRCIGRVSVLMSSRRVDWKRVNRTGNIIFHIFHITTPATKYNCQISKFISKFKIINVLPIFLVLWYNSNIILMLVCCSMGNAFMQSADYLINTCILMVWFHGYHKCFSI